jgi:hypothetical protein
MTGSYRGMSGRSNGAATWDLSEELETVPYGWRGPLHAVENEPGVLPISLGVESLDKIVDGTSKTLLVGEHTNMFPPRRTFWAHTFGDYILSEAVPQRRIFDGDYEQCIAKAGAGGARPCMRTWYSNHPAGANFVRCDSSATTITFDIDLLVFCAMGSIAGEDEGVTDPSL